MKKLIITVVILLTFLIVCNKAIANELETTANFFNFEVYSEPLPNKESWDIGGRFVGDVVWRATVDIQVHARVKTLMGEPVVVCFADYTVKKVERLIKQSSSHVIASMVSEWHFLTDEHSDLKSKARIVDFDFGLNLDGSFMSKSGMTSSGFELQKNKAGVFLCDAGIMGRSKSIYQIATSPNWDNLFIDIENVNFFQRHHLDFVAPWIEKVSFDYLEADTSKKYYRRLSEAKVVNPFMTDSLKEGNPFVYSAVLDHWSLERNYQEWNRRKLAKLREKASEHLEIEQLVFANAAINQSIRRADEAIEDASEGKLYDRNSRYGRKLSNELKDCINEFSPKNIEALSSMEILPQTCTLPEFFAFYDEASSLYGFKDKGGNVILSPRFDVAYDSFSGRALVRENESSKFYEIINARGNAIAGKLLSRDERLKRVGKYYVVEEESHYTQILNNELNVIARINANRISVHDDGSLRLEKEEHLREEELSGCGRYYTHYRLTIYSFSNGKVTRVSGPKDEKRLRRELCFSTG